MFFSDPVASVFSTDLELYEMEQRTWHGRSRRIFGRPRGGTSAVQVGVLLAHFR